MNKSPIDQNMFVEKGKVLGICGIYTLKTKKVPHDTTPNSLRMLAACVFVCVQSMNNLFNYFHNLPYLAEILRL